MMRKVYHGSIEEIRHPLTNIGRENLDFGKGFYVTDIKKQAQIWAGLKHKFYPGSKGIVNQYDLDFDTVVNKYVYKKFEHYDREWLYFIINCRNGKKVWKKYDIIEGGVANDRVIDTIEAFMAGQIEEDKALGELSKHQPNNQICILKQSIIDNHLFFSRSFTIN